MLISNHAYISNIFTSSSELFCCSALRIPPQNIRNNTNRKKGQKQKHLDVRIPMGQVCNVYRNWENTSQADRA